MLKKDATLLLIIDVQGKLAHLVHEKQLLFENLQKLIKGARVLGLPLLWVEQNPAGLGPTIPEVADLMAGAAPISKMSFSSCRNEQFVQALNTLDRRQVLVAGIETHICVYQTTAGLVKMGYSVQVVADAVSSRNPGNKAIGLQKMQAAGAGLTSVETALFELLEVAEGDAFKEILRIVR
ncbi:hydrolase [Desulfosarcina alkanivorans]|jgi:nicotinamidase-related amidase|uniref:Hydrolase n=1 Tax=Desulfosarcina alkanivorans TaxID=571177 RepID=A0A5K7YRJ8_9BACT|nr:hydrolase [Desulfosarcina alkanivorans]BBO70945.1 hydrolase [Desulfosarcina alkanivorans]